MSDPGDETGSSAPDGPTNGDVPGAAPGRGIAEEPTDPASAVRATEPGTTLGGAKPRDEPRHDPIRETSIWPPPGGANPEPRGPAVSIPGLELPDFEVLAEIGRGGQGIVYKAWQPRLKRLVALKVLSPPFASDPAWWERFRHEARVVAGLVDKGILAVHDIIETAAGPVLVLPLIDGCDLGKILRARAAIRNGSPAGVSPPHPWSGLGDREYLACILPALDQLVDAVAALHQAGVLHRDIKPSNVLIDSHDHVRLGDFGLARLGLVPPDSSPASVFGTPGYIAPEQREGRPDVDARADVFGLGATLYHALTLELPYSPTTLPEHAPPPQPPHRRQRALGSDFDAVLLKAVEPDRRYRYTSAAEFRDDWQRTRAGLPPRARRLGPGRRLLRWAGRRPWVVATALLAGLMLGFLAGRIHQHLNRPDRPRLVELETSPPCERFVFVRLDDRTGEARPENAWTSAGAKPTSIRVPPGDYLVAVGWPDGRFHEVFRHVPRLDRQSLPPIHSSQSWTSRADGTLVLRTVHAPPDDVTAGMAAFPGSPDTPPFYLDTAEFPLGRYRALRKRHPVDMDEASIRRTADAEAVAFIKFYDALEIAEMVGKRLPTHWEYLEAYKSPQATDAPAADPTAATPRVSGLRAGLKEWTTSWYAGWLNGPALLEDIARDPSQFLVVEGGPPPPMVPPQLAGLFKGSEPLEFQQGMVASAQVGLRCARSVRSRFLTP